MCEFGFLNFFTIFVEVRIPICSSIENLSAQLLLPIYRSLSTSIVHGIFVFCGCSALVFWVTKIGVWIVWVVVFDSINEVATVVWEVRYSGSFLL